MKNITIISIITVCATASLAENRLNDLSHRTSKKIDIDVVTAKQACENGISEDSAFFFIDHPYTNTLRCEITADIPVMSNGKEKMIRVTMPEEIIFPKAAFPGTTLSYQIKAENALKENEKIKLNYRRIQKGAAICSGLGPDYRLSKRTCIDLVDHDEACRDLVEDGKRKYPVYINDQYLGICSCN